MAYDKGNLNKIGGTSLKGNAPQVFTYANKAGDTVTAANFFDPAAGLMAPGDIIRVVAFSGSTPSGVADYYVTAVADGAVTVAAVAAGS